MSGRLWAKQSWKFDRLPLIRYQILTLLNPIANGFVTVHDYNKLRIYSQKGGYITDVKSSDKTYKIIPLSTGGFAIRHNEVVELWSFNGKLLKNLNLQAFNVTALKNGMLAIHLDGPQRIEVWSDEGKPLGHLIDWWSCLGRPIQLPNGTLITITSSGIMRSWKLDEEIKQIGESTLPENLNCLSLPNDRIALDHGSTIGLYSAGAKLLATLKDPTIKNSRMIKITSLTNGSLVVRSNSALRTFQPDILPLFKGSKHTKLLRRLTFQPRLKCRIQRIDIFASVRLHLMSA